MEFVSVTGPPKELEGQITASRIKLCREVQKGLNMIYCHIVNSGVERMETNCTGNKEQVSDILHFFLLPVNTQFLIQG